MRFKAPRGTADVLPGEVEKWHYVEQTIRDICRRFRYREVRTPYFEHTELFLRGVGETTDIVEKEMYSFRDRGDREITLRPEGTAGAVRAFVEHKYDKQPQQPTKWYYYGPMFRYERPQAGRMRQFTQFGVELFGTNDPAADAEVIVLALAVARELGLKQLRTEINSVGCQNCRPAYRERLLTYFNPVKEKLCRDCRSRLERNPLRILDCKNESCRQVIKGAPSILEALCSDCSTHFAQVRQMLEALGVHYTVNERMVRGLDYYTQTAFEIVKEGIGAQAGTVFAGGRYNDLIREIGGDDLPGIGFAGGIERLLLALEKEGIQWPLESRLDCYVVTLGEAADLEASRRVHELRQGGFSADRDYLGRKMKSQLKVASRENARFAVIIGEEEIERGTVQVKHLVTGKQEEVATDRLLKYIQSHMEQEER